VVASWKSSVELALPSRFGWAPNRCAAGDCACLRLGSCVGGQKRFQHSLAGLRGCGLALAGVAGMSYIDDTPGSSTAYLCAPLAAEVEFAPLVAISA